MRQTQLNYLKALNKSYTKGFITKKKFNREIKDFRKNLNMDPLNLRKNAY